MLLEVGRGVEYSKLQYFSCLNHTNIRHLAFKFHPSAKLKEVFGLKLANKFKFPFLGTFVLTLNKNIMKNGRFFTDYQIYDLDWLIK